MTNRRLKLIARSAMAAFIATVVLDRVAPAQGAAVGKIELPPYKGTLRDDYYPDDARAHHLQGRALVEFSLNGSGVPSDVVVVPQRRALGFDRPMSEAELEAWADSSVRLFLNGCRGWRRSP